MHAKNVKAMIVWVHQNLQRGRDFDISNDHHGRADNPEAIIGLAGSVLPSTLYMNNTEDILAMKLALGI